MGAYEHRAKARVLFLLLGHRPASSHGGFVAASEERYPSNAGCCVANCSPDRVDVAGEARLRAVVAAALPVGGIACDIQVTLRATPPATPEIDEA